MIGVAAPITPNHSQTYAGGLSVADLDITLLDWVDRARFWSKVEVGPIEACWPWRGSRRRSGHGEVKLQGQSRSAHRVAYMLTVGPVRADEIVRHVCDNPECCNPAHLRLGSHADNVADRVRRRRSAYGENSGRAKLREADVLHIAESELDGATLARMYGVSTHTIYAIKQHKTWRHLWT